MAWSVEIQGAIARLVSLFSARKHGSPILNFSCEAAWNRGARNFDTWLIAGLGVSNVGSAVTGRLKVWNRVCLKSSWWALVLRATCWVWTLYSGIGPDVYIR